MRIEHPAPLSSHCKALSQPGHARHLGPGHPLLCGDCPEHCRMLSSIPVSCRLDANSTHLQVVATKMVRQGPGHRSEGTEGSRRQGEIWASVPAEGPQGQMSPADAFDVLRHGSVQGMVFAGAGRPSHLPPGGRCAWSVWAEEGAVSSPRRLRGVSDVLQESGPRLLPSGLQSAQALHRGPCGRQAGATGAERRPVTLTKEIRLHGSGGCAHPLRRENAQRDPSGNSAAVPGSRTAVPAETLQEPLHTESQEARTHVHSAVLITAANTGPPRVRGKQTNLCARGLW